jgi:hypothetical protein
MPIRPETRHLYPADWPAISRWVRFERAQGRCERCAAPHGETIERSADGAFYRLPDGGVFSAETGAPRDASCPSGLWGAWRAVKIVLTTAHIDHDAANNPADGSNWAAWCQRCHLRHDRDQHVQTRRATERAAAGIADLFEGATE